MPYERGIVFFNLPENMLKFAPGSLSDLKEIGPKSAKRPGGSYFAAFSTNRITIGLQNPQNMPSPSHFFATILQVRQAASAAADAVAGEATTEVSLPRIPREKLT
jgi:hypothetical protein